MNWILLIIAGLLECCWAVGLKYTEGFTKPFISTAVVLTIVASMGLLGLALRSLPVGTGYAVWVGIGVLGTAIAGIVLFKEPVTFGRVFFLALLGTAIIGLKMTSPE
jgi:quaternary ammonium compound-resistance protein SugE